MYEHRTVPMHADCLMRRLNAECGDIGVLCLGKGDTFGTSDLKVENADRSKFTKMGRTTA